MTDFTRMKLGQITDACKKDASQVPYAIVELKRRREKRAKDIADYKAKGKNPIGHEKQVGYLDEALAELTKLLVGSKAA